MIQPEEKRPTSLDLMVQRGLPRAGIRPYVPGQKCTECGSKAWLIGRVTVQCRCGYALPRSPSLDFNTVRILE